MSRAARCLAFLVAAEEVCQEEEALEARIAATASEAWLEIASLKELFACLDVAELHAHQVVACFPTV